MYKVISLSASRRRDILGLNCSESTTSFSFGIMYEVSHESSQITVQNGPCLFASALSLRCVWDLRLEFHFSNCPFIHLCESQFYYCFFIMRHQLHLMLISYAPIIIVSIYSILFPGPAGGWGSFVGLWPTPLPLIPGLRLVGFGQSLCSECPNSFVDSVFSEEACEVSPSIVCKKPKVFSRHDVSEAAHVNAKSPLFAVKFAIPRPVAILSQ